MPKRVGIFSGVYSQSCSLGAISAQLGATLNLVEPLRHEAEAPTTASRAIIGVSLQKGWPVASRLGLLGCKLPGVRTAADRV